MREQRLSATPAGGSGDGLGAAVALDGDTVVAQQTLHVGKKLPEVRLPHMLEHADRNDTIERFIHIPIISQLEADSICEPHCFGPFHGDPMLLLGQRDAEHLDIRNAREVKPHATPATTDIKHFLAWF